MPCESFPSTDAEMGVGASISTTSNPRITDLTTRNGPRNPVGGQIDPENDQNHKYGQTQQENDHNHPNYVQNHPGDEHNQAIYKQRHQEVGDNSPIYRQTNPRNGHKQILPENDSNHPVFRQSYPGVGQIAYGPARSQYTYLGDCARRFAPHALNCALLCGGRRCKYDRPQAWPPDQTALPGLYSHWITEDILAMARPNTESIAAWNIIQQFHSWGIRSVINLQVVGEHARCGPPLEKSGFTYDPSIFMNNNIYFYNFTWRDYGAAGLRALLDAVKVLSFAITEGRVAVHCHAGLGRTGVLVACYLVYALRARADEAIAVVRARRPNSIQTQCQVDAVHHFERYLLPQTAVFSIREPLKDRHPEFGLLQHLHRQHATLHGSEERMFRYLPKIVFCLGERLVRACGCDDGCLSSFPSLVSSSGFLSVRVRQSRPPCASSAIPAAPCATCVHELNSPDDDALQLAPPASPASPRSLSPPSSPTGESPIITASQVVEALLMDHQSLPEERKSYLRNFQTDLNSRPTAFSRIPIEGDLRIISALLLEWLEGLKAPVLDPEDLTIIIIHGEQPAQCLERLDLEDAILVEYLMCVVARLRSISCEGRSSLIRRLAGALSQQGVRVRGVLRPGRARARPMRAGTVTHLQDFLTRLHDIICQESAVCKACDERSVFPAIEGKKVNKMAGD